MARSARLKSPTRMRTVWSSLGILVSTVALGEDRHDPAVLERVDGHRGAVVRRPGVTPLASSCETTRVLRRRAEGPEQREGEHNAHDRPARTEDPPRNPRRRKIIGRARSESRRSWPLARSGVETSGGVPLERPLREEVLAPRRQTETEHEQADTQEDAFPLGLAADPEDRTVAAQNPASPDDQDQTDQRLGTPRVLGVGLQVGVVEPRELERRAVRGPVPFGRMLFASGCSAEPAPSPGVTSSLMPPSSPIQKATNISPPTPISSPTNPSATGPIPPSPTPPWLSGCWIWSSHRRRRR